MGFWGSVEKLGVDFVKRRAVGGLVLQQVAAAIQVLFQLLTLAILARFLSPEDFGVFSIATVFANFAGLISQLGVGPALVQHEKLTDTHVSTGFTLSLVVGATLAVCLYVSAPVIAGYYSEPLLSRVLKIVGVSFVLSSAATVSISLIQRRLEFQRFVLVTLTSYLIGYCLVSIAMALMGYGLWALVGGTIAQAAVKLVLGFVLSPHKLVLGFSLPVAKDLLSFGGGFTLARIFNYFATQGDYVVLGRIAGASVLGVYSRAYQLMAVPASQLGSVLERVLFPVWARTQRDKSLLARYFIVASGGLAFVTMTASAVLVVIAPEVVRVVLGPQWSDVVIPFQIMTVVLFARTGYKLSDSLAKATGAVYSRAARELLYALMVVVGTYVGYHWGLLGASVGVSLAITLNWLIGLSFSRRILGLSRRLLAGTYAKPALFAFSTSIVTWGIRKVVLELLPSSPAATLVITVAATGVLLTTVSLVVPSVLGREISMFVLALLEIGHQQKWCNWLRKRIETGIKTTEQNGKGA